jgi:hypothetical protein
VAYDLFGGGSRKGDREFAYVTRQLQVNSQITDRDHGCVLPKRIAPQPPLVSAHHRLSDWGFGDAQLLESDAQYITHLNLTATHSPVLGQSADSLIPGSPTPLRNLQPLPGSPSRLGGGNLVSNVLQHPHPAVKKSSLRRNCSRV